MLAHLKRLTMTYAGDCGAMAMIVFESFRVLYELPAMTDTDVSLF